MEGALIQYTGQKTVSRITTGQYRDKIGTSRDKTPVGKGRGGVREDGLRHLKALKV